MRRPPDAKRPAPGKGGTASTSLLGDTVTVAARCDDDECTVATWDQLALFDTTPIPKASHPAKFSTEIVAVLAELIPAGAHVHDPFAGTGERLGALADRLGVTFTGTELEPSFIVNPRVRAGDATDPDSYPTTPHIIVTSPVYPNGMADHFAAADSSKRNTYRSYVGQNEGADRPLHSNNMGRYGYRGRGPTSANRAAYWRLADEAVRCWGRATYALVNVSDFLAGGVIEPVTKPWCALLERHHWHIVEVRPVVTRRQRHGANGAERVDHEDVIVARRVTS